MRMDEALRVSFESLASQYCETQEQSISGLLDVFIAQHKKWECDGWALYQCEMLDSTYLGRQIIMPFGKNNTFVFETLPPHITVGGLASRTVTLAAYCCWEDVKAASHD